MQLFNKFRSPVAAGGTNRPDRVAGRGWVSVAVLGLLVAAVTLLLTAGPEAAVPVGAAASGESDAGGGVASASASAGSGEDLIERDEAQNSDSPQSVAADLPGSDDRSGGEGPEPTDAGAEPTVEAAPDDEPDPQSEAAEREPGGADSETADLASPETGPPAGSVNDAATDVDDAATDVDDAAAVVDDAAAVVDDAAAVVDDAATDVDDAPDAVELAPAEPPADEVEPQPQPGPEQDEVAPVETAVNCVRAPCCAAGEVHPECGGFEKPCDPLVVVEEGECAYPIPWPECVEGSVTTVGCVEPELPPFGRYCPDGSIPGPADECPSDRPLCDGPVGAVVNPAGCPGAEPLCGPLAADDLEESCPPIFICPDGSMPGPADDCARPPIDDVPTCLGPPATIDDPGGCPIPVPDPCLIPAVDCVEPPIVIDPPPVDIEPRCEPFRPTPFIGVSLALAEATANEMGYGTRIASADGEHYMLTMDFWECRVNFDLVAGVVTGVTQG